MAFPFGSPEPSCGHGFAKLHQLLHHGLCRSFGLAPYCEPLRRRSSGSRTFWRVSRQSLSLLTKSKVRNKRSRVANHRLRGARTFPSPLGSRRLSSLLVGASFRRQEFVFHAVESCPQDAPFRSQEALVVHQFAIERCKNRRCPAMIFPSLTETFCSRQGATLSCMVLKRVKASDLLSQYLAHTSISCRRFSNASPRR